MSFLLNHSHPPCACQEERHGEEIAKGMNKSVVAKIPDLLTLPVVPGRFSM